MWLKRCGDAVVLFHQQFAVNARLVVKSLQRGNGSQLEQVLVALETFGKQNQVIGTAVEFRFALLAVSGRDVGFDAENGLNPDGFGFAVEVGDAVHDAMVGDGEGRHFEFGGMGDKVTQPVGSVEEGKLGMAMQMDEIFAGHNSMTAFV